MNPQRYTAQRRLNSLSNAKLMAAMMDDAHTIQELTDICGLSLFTTRHYVLTLHKEGVCHIEHWQQDSRGRHTTAAYQIGRGKDAKKPKVTRAEQQRRFRLKRKQREMMFALAAVPLKLAA